MNKEPIPFLSEKANRLHTINDGFAYVEHMRRMLDRWTVLPGAKPLETHQEMSLRAETDRLEKIINDDFAKVQTLYS